MTCVKNSFPQDKLGQRIYEGSYIIYGHNLGRCAALRVGVVRKIKEKVLKCSWKEDLQEDERWSFRIRGIDDDNVFNRFLDEDRKKIRLLSKDSTLMFSSRIFVIDDSQIPVEYLDLFNQLEGIK